MKIYSFDYHNWPKIEDEVALCLGFFDGLHKGHYKLISEAKKSGYNVALLTFDKSVSELFEKDTQLITFNEDKIELCRDLNVSYYLEVKIDNDFLNISKDDFLEKIIEFINPKIIYCGEDYSFGKNKEGNVEYLSSKINTKIIPFELHDDKKISSSEIVRMINDGNVKDAFKMLGRFYKISGEVIKGLENGKKIGFPTANINIPNNAVKPKEGVYFGYALVDGKEYPALASYGTHPTINELDIPILEVHILNFKKDLYGKNISFSFARYLRENIYFNSENDLKKQIDIDIQSVSPKEKTTIKIALIIYLLFVIGFALILFLIL